MKYIVAILILFLTSSVTYAGASSPGSYYVSSNSLNVRLAPNIKGKITNVLDKRQKVEVYEIRGGWARISDYYAGDVEGLPGEVARWVFSEYLSDSLPKAKKTTSSKSQIAIAIRKSDDIGRYLNVFVAASKKLINSGNCTLSDFEYMGGWVRSSNHRPRPVYFTYCGGMTLDNRIYLDAESRTLSR